MIFENKSSVINSFLLAVSGFEASDLIALLSLAVSLFALISSLYHRKINLKVIQFQNGYESCFIESYDEYINRELSAPLNNKGVYISVPKSCLIFKVCIVNNSNLPITLLKFSINDENVRDFFENSYKQSFFTTAFKNSADDSPRVLYGTREKPLKYIEPLTTIAPYDAVTGYLIFETNSSFTYNPGKYGVDYVMTIHTTRGKKKTKVSSSFHLESKYSGTY